MASRGYDEDGPRHDAVVSNLMDIQARLRGDPASLVLPRDGRRDDSTTVRHDDVSVTVGDEDLEPERRIEALKRRLEHLELEIDAYEHGAGASQHAAEKPVDDDASEQPATP
jgi:hypothetical protein